MGNTQTLLCCSSCKPNEQQKNESSNLEPEKDNQKSNSSQQRISSRHSHRNDTSMVQSKGKSGNQSLLLVQEVVHQNNTKNSNIVQVHENNNNQKHSSIQIDTNQQKIKLNNDQYQSNIKDFDPSSIIRREQPSPMIPILKDRPGTDILPGKSEISIVSHPKILDDTWLNNFTFEKQLKKEVFGDLYIVKLKQNKQLRILRKIRKSLLSRNNNQDVVDEFRTSMDDIRELEHPNIAQIYDYREDLYNFYILQEFCEGGRLFPKIESLSDITENLAAEIIRQVLSAIVYLHSKSLVYKNLSPDYLLLESKDDIEEGLNIKLINIDIQAAVSTARRPFQMSPIYFQAPEAQNNAFSDKQDVWSCGIILSTLLTGFPPYIQESAYSFCLKTIVQGQLNFESKYWKSLSPDALNLVKNLLENDSSQRITAVQALNYKWLLNLTKAKSHNQKIKILNKRISLKMQIFLAETRLIDCFNQIVQQFIINQEEEKALTSIFGQKDHIGEGDLKIDQIREGFLEYMGKFVDKDELDTYIGGCTISIVKKGMIRYGQFIQVRNKKAIDRIKNHAKDLFEIYDKLRLKISLEESEVGPDLQQIDNRQPLKEGFLSMNEVKRLLSPLFKSNNNQYDQFLQDYDNDQDRYLNIDAVLKLIHTICNH